MGKSSKFQSSAGGNKYGRDKTEAKGLILGKRGAKRRHATKAMRQATHMAQVKKGDKGYAKKAKRRALRTVVVPAALKGTAKRTPKGLVVTSMLVGEEVAKKMAAEARAEAAEARMEDDVGTA
jgi:hypothetical protein